MDNNMAFVAKIGDIREIPGADKIVSAKVFLEGVPQTTVVVGKDMEDGESVVYFDSNLCLTQEFIERLDFEDSDYGKDGFRSIGAYLGKNNRVKAIKLRGCISNGLVIKASRLFSFFNSLDKARKTLVDGYAFDTLEGFSVCKKYEIPVQAQRQQTKKEKNKEKVLSRHFPEHPDTLQLTRNMNKINPDTIIHISEKWHGTSARTGNVLVKRKLSWIEKILLKIGAPIPTTRYAYVHGSRRVVKYITGEIVEEKKHYYEEDLWKQAGEKFFGGKLHQGEMVYYEIVGWTLKGTPIQKVGRSIYNYGAKDGEYKIVVYRITLTNSTGYAVDYSPTQIRDRCNEMGVDYVVELYHGKAKDLFPDILTDSSWNGIFLDCLRKTYLEKMRTDCMYRNTPDEGIVIRVDSVPVQFFKLKSESFLLAETKSFEEGTTTDTEDGGVIV